MDEFRSPFQEPDRDLNESSNALGNVTNVRPGLLLPKREATCFPGTNCHDGLEMHFNDSRLALPLDRLVGHNLTIVEEALRR